MVNELKSCPFCGKQPNSRWYSASICGEDDSGYWGIDCCYVHVHLDTEAEAITAWNTRADTGRLSELEAEVARLRSALEPFADIADLIESETEGFSDTDELQLTFHDYLFQNFSVAMFKRARAALRSQS